MTHTTHTPPVRGFSLIETLIVLGIILIITTVLLLGQSGFNKTLVLMDTSYTVAFTIRQAQALGLSSKRSGSISNTGYGVHVGAAPTTSFLLFADTYPAAQGNVQGTACPGHLVGTGLEARPGNCTYDGAVAPPDTVNNIYTLNKGFKISNYCGIEKGTNAKRCSGTGVSALDITFMRPNTQAVLTGQSAGVPIEFTSVGIEVSMPDDSATRCVVVTRVGQVSVVDVCP